MRTAKIFSARRGFAVILVIGIALVATGVGAYKYLGEKGLRAPGSGASPSEQNPQASPRARTTTPNNTTNWTFFNSELYKYSLKYPNNFKIIVGNKNIFQANSKNYVEENGVVTTGAITQVIASDTSDSFEQAWGNIDKTLKNLDIKILSKENVLVDGQEAYKLRLEHPDGTTEIRYLTYKSPYSYKITIVVGKGTSAEVDNFEQILDDIISTFNF